MSLVYSHKYSLKEIVKGKMRACELVHVQECVAPAQCLHWPCPWAGYVALSVDGSFFSADGTVAAGMILRREDGSVIFSAYRYIFNCNEAL